MLNRQVRALPSTTGLGIAIGRSSFDDPSRGAKSASNVDASASIMASTLDALAGGAFVLRPDCTLIYANCTARTMLASAGVLWLCGDRVRTTDTDSDDAFARMVSATATFASTSAMCLRTPRGARLTVTTKVVKPTGDVLMLAAGVHRGERQTATQLKSAFGLTPAEADIARSLSIGLSPAEIATARSALPSTVQSQIKSIASKLGCRRQSEIIAIVQAIPQFMED